MIETFDFFKFSPHALKGQKLLAQGIALGNYGSKPVAFLIVIAPRAMPWAKSFCPFRACCFWKLLGLQPVLKPLAKLESKNYSS